MLRWLALAWLCAAAAAVDTGGCVDEANQCARSFTGQGVCTDFAGYTGTKNVTMFGHPCERWDALGGNPYPDGSSAFLLTKVASLSDLGNRCVSWAHFGGGPWCRVTTIGGNDWQYCFPPCGEAECVDEAAQCARRASRGVCDNYLAYTGTKDTAADGTPCHPWSDSSNVDRGFDTFNVSKVAEGALCRNPDRDTKGPWCYTATNNGGPKPCFPDCPDPVDPCIDLHPNRTIDQGNGNAIATTPGRSLAQCAVDCVAHSACGTFVWTEDQNCVLQATPPPFEESLSAENATSTVAGINRCAQTEVLEDGSTCFVHYPLTDAYMPITHFFDATPDISTCASECSLVGETCTGATYKEVGEDCWLLNVTKAQVLEAAVTETQLSLLLRCPGPPTTSTTAALTTTERPCVQLYPNQTVDTSGDHILETLSGVSLEGCSAACRARSACTAFVWQADESKCLLKATPPPYDGTLASSDRLAGIDTCAEVSKVHHSAVCFIRYPETEFVGPNIGSTAVGEASCAELCADSPICNGLLFEQDPEYCWFYGQAKKDIIKGSETASNHTLYVRCEEPRNNCSSFYSGKSFGDDDGDLLETQAGLSSAEECAEACVRRSACSVFEWLHTSSECRLLATPDLDASALEVAVGTNITSGIDTCAQVTEVDVSGGCFVRYPDTHFQGTPVVDDFSVNDETACVEACQANTSCVGVAYETDRKYCWLMPQDREMLLLGSFTQLLRVLLVRCPRPTTTTAELTTTEKPCVQLFSNNTIDTGGGRLLRTVAGQTVAQCAAECRATPACTTFVLDKNNECSLKGTRQPFNDKLNDKAGNWAGMDTCAQVSEVTAGGVCFVRYPDTRFGGGHIGMVVVGETECLGYCASSELCNGVTRNANGTCRFLGLRTSQLLRGSGTALNQTLLTRCSETDQIRVNPCVHHYPNTSVVGGDLLKNMTELGSLGDCGEACVRLASCSVFQWDDGTKECLLVSTPQPYEGALEPWTLADRTAGINTCAGISEVNLDGACFVRYADTDYPLANVRVQDPQNETSCGLLCADDAQCNGAVFQKLTETCWVMPGERGALLSGSTTSLLSVLLVRCPEPTTTTMLTTTTMEATTTITSTTAVQPTNTQPTTTLLYTPPCWTEHPDTKLKGPVFQSDIPAANLATCAELCLANASCRGANFKNSSSLCFLKKAFACEPLVAEAGVTAVDLEACPDKASPTQVTEGVANLCSGVGQRCPA